MIRNCSREEGSSEADPGIDPAIVHFITAAKEFCPALRRHKSAPSPVQLSRARRGVWKAPAHAHSQGTRRE